MFLLRSRCRSKTTSKIKSKFIKHPSNKHSKIDAKKCISYLTIEHRGEFEDRNINLDSWIYGCDICQEVCPWNKKFEEASVLDEFQPRTSIVDYNNDDWNNLSEKNYTNLFTKSPVKRTKYKGLKRNINQNKKEQSSCRE